MAFSITSNDVPYVGSYEAAKRMFTNLTPIRGGDVNVKRFVNRSDRSKLLKLEYEDDVEVYSYIYYQTPVVKYYPTYIEIYLGGWSSQSTIGFLSGVTGFNARNATLTEALPAGFRGANVTLEVDAFFNGYPIKSNERYQFTYDGTPVEGQELPVNKKYVVNKARMKAVREQYKPFKQYIHAMTPMIDMSNDEIVSDIFQEARTVYPRMREVLKAIDDNDYWRAFQLLAYEAHDTHWGFDASGVHGIHRSLNASRLYRRVETEVKQHHSEVLDEVVL